MNNFFATYPVEGGVTSLNGLTGALTLVAGTGITITPSGNTLTIDASGGSGADTALDNLTPTAINQNLIFDNNANYFIQSPDDPGAGETKDLTVKTGDTAAGDLTGNLNLITGNAGAGGSGEFRAKSGAATGGKSGDVVLQPGTSDTEVGIIRFNDSDGDTLLSLTPGIGTIAVDLVPDSPIRNIGAAGNQFGTGFFSKISDANAQSINVLNRILFANDGGTAQLDWSTPGTIDLKQSILNNIVIQSGATGARPGTPVVGQTYFDTSLAAGAGQPIWFNGTNWVDATGTVV